MTKLPMATIILLKQEAFVHQNWVAWYSRDKLNINNCFTGDFCGLSLLELLEGRKKSLSIKSCLTLFIKGLDPDTVFSLALN